LNSGTTANPDNGPILVKEMMDGSRVLAILNTEQSEKEISFSISDLGIEKAEVRDVWRKTDLGKVSRMIVSKLSGDGVCLYHIKPVI
jgi:hypothetical protein